MSHFGDSTTLPLTGENNVLTQQHTSTFFKERSAMAKRSKFLRRLVYFQHMDFEFALWQMLYLFISPQKVYRNFQYRKQTKNQFARDDPAFLVLLSFCLVDSSYIGESMDLWNHYTVWLPVLFVACLSRRLLLHFVFDWCKTIFHTGYMGTVSSVGFALVLKIHFLGFCKFLLWVIFIDCIGVGIFVSTLLWFVCNRYLRKPLCRDQDVEWAYAFDVHLNAFFPLLIILHIFQLFFYHLLTSQHTFIARLVGNTFWLLALGYYVYITFLGYSAVPILEKTQVLLYPLTVIFVFYLIALIGGWNICGIVMDFYKYRVL